MSLSSSDNSHRLKGDWAKTKRLSDTSWEGYIGEHMWDMPEDSQKYWEVMFKRGSAEIPQDTVRAEADMLCGNSCLDLTWLFFFSSVNGVSRYSLQI